MGLGNLLCHMEGPWPEGLVNLKWSQNSRQSPGSPSSFLVSWDSSAEGGVQPNLQSPVTRACDFVGKMETEI